MAVSSRLRLGILALAGALLIALALLLMPSSGSGATTAAATGGRTPGRQMLLRPQDAGKHFFLLDFGEEESAPALFCDLLHPATPPPNLAAWLESDKPRGCFAVYGQLIRHGKKLSFPWVVGTGALDAGSEAEAVTGFDLADELLAEFASGEPLKEVAAPGTVGDETRLFHFPRGLFFSGSRRAPGSILAWRSGDVLAAVFAEGGGTRISDDRKALTLAKRQQRKRVEHPSPFPLPAS